MTKELVVLYGIIYKCTNLINGKIYIGQTIKSLKCRKAQHEITVDKNRGFYFHNAIRKYGKENFKWEIIDSGLSKIDLNNKEIFYINVFDLLNHNFGYNIKSGGSEGNPYAGKTIEEMNVISKRKSQAFKGRIFSKEHCLKIKNSKRNFNEEKWKEIKRKQKQTNANKTNEQKEQEKLKRKNTFENKSEDEKLRISRKHSESISGEKHHFYGKNRPEHSVFMKSKFNHKKGKESKLYGRKHSEETKRKIGDKHRNKIVSKESIEKQKISRKKTMDNKTEEEKKSFSRKISEATSGGKNPRAIKVMCVETGEIFDCLKSVNIKGLTKKAINENKSFYGSTYKII